MATGKKTKAGTRPKVKCPYCSEIQETAVLGPKTFGRTVNCNSCDKAFWVNHSFKKSGVIN